MPEKPVIFISYSHKDEPTAPEPGEVRWRTYVTSHLQPAVKNGIFDLWVDHDIGGGADWRAAVEEKLNNCDISVLLVSRHALSSDFILDVEVKRMLERRETDRLPIIPIVLSPFATDTVPWLMAMNLRPREGKALSTFAMADRDTKMAEIASEVAALAREIAKTKSATSKSVTILAPTAEIKVEAKPATIIVGEGRRETKLAETEAISGLVDLTHLPELAYERLVGREKELKKIDDAWAGTGVNILSLVAEGGAGKSALVNEWLKRFQADSYRGAEGVLGWSFYSQGSKERATSAETFLNWALEKLGIQTESTSTSAKGEMIAEALMRQRILLVLDGVEPLQHGPGAQVGQLKDLGLRALLRRIAGHSVVSTHSLVVLSSRLAIKDIEKWKYGAARVINVEQLSQEAGASLLRDNGVLGTDRELRAASRDFEGHPLALGLLASYLKEKHFGDVRRRGNIRAYLADPENPRHDHAKRVMESYEREWLASEPELLAIMYIVGLFDRPASVDCLDALRKRPVIEGLTDSLVDLDDTEWNDGVTRLREVRLLAEVDQSAPGALDAHPLVREWFGQQLKTVNEAAWRAAHGRLYEHLRDLTSEGSTPTLEDLAPLYQAITHGCRAGRHQEAFSEVYDQRLSRRTPEGMNEFYSIYVLGAIGSDLAALSNFFERPFETPAKELPDSDDRRWLLALAAYELRTQGRLSEALAPVEASLNLAVAESDWANAAVAAFNLSFAQLLNGRVNDAIENGALSLEYAKRSKDKYEIISRCTIYADVLHAAGRLDEAQKWFDEAVQVQESWRGDYPVIRGQWAYRYSDFLLSKANWKRSQDWAEHVLNSTGPRSLVDAALELLAHSRSLVGLAVAEPRDKEGSKSSRADNDRLKLAIDDVVNRMRGAADLAYMPVVLVARAAFSRFLGNWEGATLDLEEIEEIAEPGSMRLYLCDLALERSRLAFAQIEAFAPLNGMLEKDNPPKPEVPSPEKITELKAEAENQIKIADGYIQSCGYRRRDEELAELKDVLAGKRTFASLPPRV